MLPVYYQGQDIYKGIRIKNPDTGELIVLDDFMNIVIYLYTNTNRILKYSKLDKIGYYSIIKVSSTYYYLWIDSFVTKDLSTGKLTMELKVVKTQSQLVDGKEDLMAITECGEIRPSQMLSDDAIIIGDNRIYGDLVVESTQIVGDSGSQISAISLSGVTDLNTTNYVLYWSIIDDNGYILKLYSDLAKTLLVAESDRIYSTNYNIIEQNNSGITGTLEMDVVSVDSGSGNSIICTMTNQISELSILGATLDNTDSSNLYWDIIYNVDGDVSIHFNLYMDSAKTQLVAYAVSTESGTTVDIVESGSSGLSGTVKLTYLHDDIDTANRIYMFENTISGHIIIYGDSNSQLSNIYLFGLTTSNSDNYKLYWKLIDDGQSGKGFYLYANPSKTTPVARGYSLLDNYPIDILEMNSSGLTGIATIDYTINDNDDENIILIM